MTARSPLKNVAASVKQRLLNLSRDEGIDPNLLFTRFALERFLYRLSCSPHAKQFTLKGAALMLVWFGSRTRPTRDVDFLGSGTLSPEELERIFRNICDQPAEPDGIQYLPQTVTVTPIRDEDEYGGNRITLQSRLGNARLHLRIDVGIGDAVIPPPEWIEYPTLLDMPGPRLLVYRPETSIAEKLHTMVVRNLANSRMKDFYDILTLSRAQQYNSTPLVAAVRNTFIHRQTPLPENTPTALSREFGNHPEKQKQWQAFLSKNRLEEPAKDLEIVIEELAAFLLPVLAAARDDKTTIQSWPPGGPWQTDEECAPNR